MESLSTGSFRPRSNSRWRVFSFDSRTAGSPPRRSPWSSSKGMGRIVWTADIDLASSGIVLAEPENPSAGNPSPYAIPAQETLPVL